MAKIKKPPHLIADGTLKRCSVCKMPFMMASSGESMEIAFAKHVLAHHQPGQTSEDVNQAAARIVRESTDGK